MANTEQQKRRKVRDRKKTFDGIVSSIKSTIGDDCVSTPMIMQVVNVAHDLNLGIIGLIALEALKVADRDKTIEHLRRSNAALEKLVVEERANLRQAQETIAKMNTRYVRRGSKKARAQHPEKRRGR